MLPEPTAFLTLGCGGYLVVRRLSSAVFEGHPPEGRWLIHATPQFSDFRIMYLGPSACGVSVLAFRLQDISVHELSEVNDLLRHPQVRIVHSTGLYVHDGILRCEMALVHPDSKSADGAAWLGRQVRVQCTMHEVPVCESF